MERRENRWMRLAMAFALIAIMFVPTASAQRKDDDRPFFDVPAIEHQKPYIQWIVGAAFGVGCVLIAFKNPHRSHLD